MLLKFSDAVKAHHAGTAGMFDYAILAEVGVTADVLDADALGGIFLEMLERPVSDERLADLRSAGVNVEGLYGGKVPAYTLDTGERIATGTGTARILQGVAIDPRDPLAFLFSAKRADGSALPPKEAQKIRESIQNQSASVAVRAYRDALKVFGVAIPSEVHSSATKAARDVVRSQRRVDRFSKRFNLNAPNVQHVDLLGAYRRALPVSVQDGQDTVAQDAAANAVESFLNAEGRSLKAALGM